MAALEIDGKKYYHIFTAGKYPQGDVSREDVAAMAYHYDPVNRHEACFWEGHPRQMIPMKEPEAGGWIGGLLAIGDKLYAWFSHIDPDFKKKFDEKKFKRCSVEIGLYFEGDVSFLYVYALGATNRQAVTPMEEMVFDNTAGAVSFDDRRFNEKAFKSVKCYGSETDTFTFENKQDFPNQNNYKMKLVEFTAKHNLTGSDESAVLDSASAYITKLTGQITDLETKNANFVKERAEGFVDQLLADKKITPAERDQYIKDATDNYSMAVRMSKHLKPVAAAAVNIVKSFEKANPGALAAASGEEISDDNKKFFNADGSRMNMRDFRAKCVENPAFADSFTEEDMEKIPLAGGKA